MPLIGLVLNLLDVTLSTPAEIIPGCVLRKPTTLELAGFRASLEAYSGKYNLVEMACEYDRTPANAPCPHLAPEDWRYWVVEAADGPTVGEDALRNVAKMSRLCSAEVPCANMVFRPPSRPFWYITIGLDPLVRFWSFGKPELLDQAIFKDIGEAWANFSKLAPAHAPIAAAIELYAGLGPMWAGKLYHALGVFAAIESLLTHDPHAGYDSLTHQIREKMVLLDNRFGIRLDYSCFGGTEARKTWQHLYAYRSAIAHGGMPDFKSKLSALRDEATAIAFLDRAAKTLLMHALKEPQLVLDLRTC